MLLNKEINVRDELSNFIPWHSSMDKSTDYTLSHTHWYGKMLMTQKKFESYVDLMIADSIINLIFNTFYEEDELEDLYSDLFEIVSKWEEYQQCDEISWGVVKDRFSLIKEFLLMFKGTCYLNLALLLLEDELYGS